MKIWNLIVFFLCLGFASCVMLKKECPIDEIHKSCSFYEEYTCWEKEDRMDRIKASPKRLTHCKSGCFCKKGLVRTFPQGKCINALHCRNRKLQIVLAKLPTDFSGFSNG